MSIYVSEYDDIFNQVPISEEIDYHINNILKSLNYIAYKDKIINIFNEHKLETDNAYFMIIGILFYILYNNKINMDKELTKFSDKIAKNLKRDIINVEMSIFEYYLYIKKKIEKLTYDELLNLWI